SCFLFVSCSLTLSLLLSHSLSLSLSLSFFLSHTHTHTHTLTHTHTHTHTHHAPTPWLRSLCTFMHKHSWTPICHLILMLSCLFPPCSHDWCVSHGSSSGSDLGSHFLGQVSVYMHVRMMCVGGYECIAIAIPIAIHFNV